MFERDRGRRPRDLRPRAQFNLHSGDVRIRRAARNERPLGRTLSHRTRQYSCLGIIHSEFMIAVGILNAVAFFGLGCTGFQTPPTPTPCFHDSSNRRRLVSSAARRDNPRRSRRLAPHVLHQEFDLSRNARESIRGVIKIVGGASCIVDRRHVFGATFDNRGSSSSSPRRTDPPWKLKFAQAPEPGFASVAVQLLSFTRAGTTHTPRTR